MLSNNNQNKIPLIKEGKSDFKIIISPSCSKSEEFATKELQRYIEMICNCSLQILKINQLTKDRATKVIIIGEHLFIKKNYKFIDYSDLKEEGYYWHFEIQNMRIIIAGSKVRGTIYGVYDFLENFFGVRFYDPDTIFIPKHNEVLIPFISKKHIPSFNFRIVTYLNLLDPDFSITQKCNLNPFAEEEHGGSIMLSTAHLTHTFYQLVDPNKYFDEHPEYFSLVKGKRLKNLGQLCLSNPDVLEIATQMVLKWFKEDSRVMSIGVVQNDWGNYCECENCKSLEDRFGHAHSAPIINFCNKIAEKIEENFPNEEKYIHTIAYTYSLKPPKNIKIHERVIVVVCDMYPNCADHKPIGEDPYTKQYVEFIKEWRKLAKNLLVWHYAVNFTHFLLPFPNFLSLYEDTKIYKKIGVDGILFQATTQLGVYGEFEEFRNWFLYKILWNCELDFRQLVDEFLRGYYKDAHSIVSEYFYELHERIKKSNNRMHLYSGLEVGYLDLDFIKKYQQKFYQQIEKTKEEEIKLKIEKILISLDYAYLIFPVQFKINFGKIFSIDLKERKIIFERFRKTLRKLNIRVVSENIPVKGFLEIQEMLCKEHNVLALAEFAPLIVKILRNVLDKVEKSLDENENFIPHQFIHSALKVGFHPMELSQWIMLKQFAQFTPQADIWTRKLNRNSIQKYFDPLIPLLKKNEIPRFIMSLLKDLPDQYEEL
ncbi:MAG: DUF4838 domain-containing protein [Promethearchaeota archaeon]